MKLTIERKETGEMREAESSRPLKREPTPIDTPERNSRRHSPFPFSKTSAPAPPAQVIGQTAGSQSPLAPTVFHEEWWLEAATEGSYSAVEVESGGKVVGRLPFMLRRRSGLVGIWTPPMTHFLGPGVDDGEGSGNNRFLHRLEITRELILKLPRSSWQCIRCHRGTTDVIAFQEESFKTYAQFTHEITPGPIPVLWQQMRNKTRNVIRRAEEQYTICELEDVDEFARLYQTNLTSRRIANTLDLSAARRVMSAALERERGRILAARNACNEIVAANFCAWDAATTYYVACTRNDGAGNGASSLLLWESIRHAAAKELVFDFSGIGTRGSVLHYAGFGGTVSTRFVAVRANGIGRFVARARLLMMDEHFLY